MQQYVIDDNGLLTCAPRIERGARFRDTARIIKTLCSEVTSNVSTYLK